MPAPTTRAPVTARRPRRATITLRPWQREALDRYLASDEPDFLTVATPGAGKTTFALAAARHVLSERPSRLVVVAPTRHLKEQWADAAERLGIALDPDWKPGDGLAADLHGVVTTYQQVGTAGPALARIAADGMVVLDEVHHAGEERSWGDGVRAAFDGARKRLCLSGTPFRSDTLTIPFVRYDADKAVADVEYGYGEAIADGRVVRPVYFPRFGGEMEWMAPDGAVLAASFDDPLARTQANQRLRAALSLDGQWLPSVLGQAHHRLMKIRERHPNAGGLVIAIDQDHAHGIAQHLRQVHRVRATVAVSDDPDASGRIARFAASDEPWIVAVRMVSEGVDIPRLRVGVYATTTTTELFFRQAVGRIVRWTPGIRNQRAYLFLPDDVRLRHWGESIAESRRHNLQRSEAETDEAAEPEVDDTGGLGKDDDGQLSLFAVLSATATDGPELDVFADDELDETDDDGAEAEIEDAALVLDLAALPVPTFAGTGRPVDRRRRDELRDRNNELARELALVTGMTHAAVNGELNRRSRITSVVKATADELERRHRRGERWLAEERRRAQRRRR